MLAFFCHVTFSFPRFRISSNRNYFCTIQYSEKDGKLVGNKVFMLLAKTDCEAYDNRTMAAEKSPTPDKLPPQNIEAEASLLGSLMMDKDAFLKVGDFLESRDFYKKIHQSIYLAMEDIFSKGDPIDVLSLAARLKEKEQLEEIGGNVYLTELINSVPTASHVMAYAKIVQKKRILRDLISVSYEIGTMGYD